MSTEIEAAYSRGGLIEQVRGNFDRLCVDYSSGHDDTPKGVRRKTVYDAATTAREAAEALARANDALTEALYKKRGDR